MLKFLAVPEFDKGILRDGVLPALRLVFYSEYFWTVHHTDYERGLRKWDQRLDSFDIDDWLSQLNCEEVSLLVDRLRGTVI